MTMVTIRSTMALALCATVAACSGHSSHPTPTNSSSSSGGVSSSSASSTSSTSSSSSMSSSSSSVNASLAGSPLSVAVDGSGNLYVAESAPGLNGVQMVTPSVAISDIAGNVLQGFVDGAGSNARFDDPLDIAVGSNGDMYVVEEFNYAVRKISGGVVTTLAGGSSPGSANGVGAAASFSALTGIALDESTGDVYVVDNEALKKIDPSGAVTDFASGQLHVNLTGGGIAVDANHNIFATSRNVIVKVTQAGTASIIAGQVDVSGSADGIGVAARFGNLGDMAIDSAGNLYVSDQANNNIRKISPAAEVTTLAGAVGVAGNADGVGTAARFYVPGGITVGLDGTVYVADIGNHSIRSISQDGRVTTLAH